MSLPAAQSGVQSLICSTPVANAASGCQLTHFRWIRTSLASAQVKMNDEGRVCCLYRQLTSTDFRLAIGVAACWVKAVSVARAGADAQPVATMASKMVISTAARFMVCSLAKPSYQLRRQAERVVAPERDYLLAPDIAGDVDDEAELGHLLVVGQRVALHRGGKAALAGQAQLIERDEPGRRLDAPLQVVGGFQL